MALLAGALVWLLLLSPCEGTGTEVSDKVRKDDLNPSRFKVTFLCKVPILATWPASAFPDTRTNIVIGVLGPDPFGGLLEEVAADEKAGGRSIVVKMNVNPEAITNCHVLFVPADQQSKWRQWREQAGERGAAGILTVGEDPDFFKSGGIIKLLPEKRVFELHLQNASAQGERLRLDPKLKRSAAKLVR